MHKIIIIHFNHNNVKKNASGVNQFYNGHPILE